MVRSRDRAEFERALPRIERHARIRFHGVRCPHRREDLVAEVLALSWMWWVRLAEQGRKPEAFVSAIATFAARAASSGRRACGQERARDVLSPSARRRYDFTLGPVASESTLSANPLSEALCDNTRTPPDEQVCFRLDFSAWQRTLSARHRRIVLALMHGERTIAVAARFGLSPARVSQLRRAFKEDWDRFIADPQGEA